MKAVVKVNIVDGKCVVIYSDGSEQELYEYPSDEGGGGGASLGTKNITSNGSYTARNDGYDGYSKVNVNVPTSADLGTKHITSNGIYDASSDNLDGYSSVSVAVTQPAPTLKRIEVTDNGVYKASDYNAYGFEQVTVNVSSGSAVDFTDAISSYENRSFGSLFASISEGKFGVIQKIVTNGMNPIEVQFPTKLKGLLIYPINVATTDASFGNEQLILSTTLWGDTYNETTQSQNVSWAYCRTKASNRSGAQLGNRITSYTMINNKLSLVPEYPANQSYNMFIFGKKYAFAYWY